MCGIVGCVAKGHSNFLSEFLHKSIVGLHHRGPDSADKWLDLSTGIGFGHTRLSIQDIRETGSQPMQSHCGRYVITFNGEIYNHFRLRETLKGKIDFWRGRSDTETLLGCISSWGLETTLTRLVGMFAFAIWDKHLEQLSLVRDRLGEKPLYYGMVGLDFVFASELHVLKHHPAWQGSICRSAIGELLRYNYIPTPMSIYENISKLEAGSFLTYDRTTNTTSQHTYWAASSIASEAADQRKTIVAEAECLLAFETNLQSAVKDQMLSDVPLGAFLSGGIDSTAIVATMQSLSSRPIKTYTVGFEEKNYNEADQARAVATHLGTDHTEISVSPGDARDIIPELARLYSEPFADSSQIPTHLISMLAVQSVKVALTGDGGDELFGGYNRYAVMDSHWATLNKMPIGFRKLAASCLMSLPSSTIDSFAASAGSLLSSRFRVSNASDKIRKIADILHAESPQAFYEKLIWQWQAPHTVVKHINDRSMTDSKPFNSSALNDIEAMMLSDQLTYLPDDIMVKVDRAAMGASLETRSPFLDHRLVAFSWSLPLQMKIRDGRGKWLVRHMVYKYVPKTLVDRPKTGFALPIDLWLRGPLKDWADSLLNENRLSREGYFNPAPIQQKWQEHLSGKSNWQQHLWSVLMFQTWLENQE